MSKTRFMSLFESYNTIFKAPYVQRNYDWDKEAIELCIDIDAIDLTNSKNSKHNLQHILIEKEYDHTLGTSGMDIIWIGDGLQRTITISLITLIIAEHYKENNNQKYKSLLNKFLNVDELNQYKYKFQLTETIKKPIYHILQSIQQDNPVNTEEYINNKVFQTYLTIKDYLSKKTIDEIDVFFEKMSQLFVIIDEVGEDENITTEFILRNRRGKPISTYNELKTYLVGKRDEYNLSPEIINYFTILENELIDETSKNPYTRIEDYFKMYLKYKHKTNQYGNFIKRFERDTNGKSFEELDDIITDIYHHYDSFKLIYCGGSKSVNLNKKIAHFRRLKKYKSIDDFLFRCAIHYNDGIITDTEFIELIDICENVLLRAYVAGNATSTAGYINKMHFYAKKEDRIDLSNYVSSFKELLLRRKGAHFVPSDTQFEEGFLTKEWKIDSGAVHFTHFVKECIEEGLSDKKQERSWDWGQSKQGIYKDTLDHIHPNNPRKENKEKIINQLSGGADEFREIDKDYKNSIGNLTPTHYNSEMQDKPLNEKYEFYRKESYKETEIILEIFSKHNKWGINEIQNFAKVQFDILLEMYPAIEVNKTLNTIKSQTKIKAPAK